MSEIGREDRLRDEGVNAAHNVNHLRHAETRGDAAQCVGVKLADLRVGGQKLDRIARRHRHRRVEVLVEGIRFPGCVLRHRRGRCASELGHARALPRAFDI